ncbi:hypothetical protein GCM10027343_36810 [Noviherbaspirillum agri]
MSVNEQSVIGVQCHGVRMHTFFMAAVTEQLALGIANECAEMIIYMPYMVAKIFSLRLSLINR